MFNDLDTLSQLLCSNKVYFCIQPIVLFTVHSYIQEWKHEGCWTILYKIQNTKSGYIGPAEIWAKSCYVSPTVIWTNKNGLQVILMVNGPSIIIGINKHDTLSRSAFMTGAATTGAAKLGLHGLLDIVAGEETSDPLHHALPPPVVVLLQHIDDLALLEGQLVFLVSVVVVDGDHLLQVVLWNPTRKGEVLGHHHPC